MGLNSELTHTVAWNENGPTTWKSSWMVSYKIKHMLTIQPSNSTLGYLLKINENVFTRMFRAALFTVAPNLEIAHNPSPGECYEQM